MDVKLLIVVGVVFFIVCGLIGVFMVNENQNNAATWLMGNILGLDRELMLNLSTEVDSGEQAILSDNRMNRDTILDYIEISGNQTVSMGRVSAGELKARITELQDGQAALEEELLSSQHLLAILNQKLMEEGVKVKRLPTGTPISFIRESDKSIQNLSNPKVDEWQPNCMQTRSNNTVCFTRVE